MLQARGEFDEALRIRREEELPVYERLGDVRSRAVTMGKIADVLQARGEIDEALRIRREEQLPVYERLGDVRSRAVTMGQIADVLRPAANSTRRCASAARSSCRSTSASATCARAPSPWARSPTCCRPAGELDEALRIRREEQLPVFERLGDVRARAVTMGQIADVLRPAASSTRRCASAARRSCRSTSASATCARAPSRWARSPTCCSPRRARRGAAHPPRGGAAGLRAARRRAVARGDHGQDRRRAAARGELDEALRIRREEQLPVYERLGDVRSRAVTMGKIADMLAGPRRARRGVAHPPRGGAAGLRAPR